MAQTQVPYIGSRPIDVSNMTLPHPSTRGIRCICVITPRIHLIHIKSRDAVRLGGTPSWTAREEKKFDLFTSLRVSYVCVCMYIHMSVEGKSGGC